MEEDILPCFRQECVGNEWVMDVDTSLLSFEYFACHTSCHTFAQVCFLHGVFGGEKHFFCFPCQWHLIMIAVFIDYPIVHLPLFTIYYFITIIVIIIILDGPF